MNARQTLVLRKTDFSIDRILANDSHGSNCATSANRLTNRQEDNCFKHSNEDSHKNRHETDRDHNNFNEEREKSHETDCKNSCTINDNADLHTGDLKWLRYTRYKPPRIPRRVPSDKTAKRKAGIHPRIPFSAYQLRILEERYKQNAYLSRRDANEISGFLRLPQSRVKIWFQNRRARERRETIRENDKFT